MLELIDQVQDAGDVVMDIEETEDGDGIIGEEELFLGQDAIADEQEAFLDETQRQFEKVNDLITEIIENTKGTINLELRAKSQTTSCELKEIMAELDHFIDGTMTAAKAVNFTLKNCKTENEIYEKEHPHSTLSAWKRNKLNTSSIRYQKALRAFNVASKSFKEVLRKKTARQARMVNEDITEEQIQQIVDSNEPTAFMQNVLMIPDVVLDRVVDIERRHEGILRIEQGVKELDELWTQLAVLVDEQQEHLDQIESNVEHTLEYIQQGKIKLDIAKRMQDNSRKTMCCFFICGMIVVIIVSIFLVT